MENCDAGLVLAGGCVMMASLKQRTLETDMTYVHVDMANNPTTRTPSDSMLFRVWDSAQTKYVSDPMSRNRALKLARNMGGHPYQVVAVST